MEQAEIEPFVGELETRVDRLRALYDQYFMGIERLEPLVPRKDVERRLAQLRKEQIRNTGVRFRFQMIVQRYNTYITYWQRITRQIDTGTYKRHVARATARFGVDPMKERASEVDPQEAAARAGAGQDEQGHESQSMPSSAPLVVIPDGEIEEVYELEALPDDEQPTEQPDPFGAATIGGPKERFASAQRFEFDDIADPFEEDDPFPKPAQKAAPKIRLAARPGQASPSPRPPPPDERRDTERRVPIAAPSSPQSSPLSSPRASPQSAPQSPQSSPQIAKRAQPEMPRTETAVPFIARRAPAPPPGVVAQVGPNTPSAAPRRPATLPSAGVPAPTGAVPLVSSAPASAPKIAPRTAPASPVITRPVTSPASTAGPAPAPASVARPAPAPASVARPAPAPASVAKAAPVPASVAKPAPSPVAKPAPAPVAKPAANVGDLSGDRFGEIFSKYVETRRQHNEPTHAITRDALAKQLHESTERLKQKHGAKAIDFEVVVKDGRTILRPVVK